MAADRPLASEPLHHTRCRGRALVTLRGGYRGVIRRGKSGFATAGCHRPRCMVWRGCLWPSGGGRTRRDRRAGSQTAPLAMRPL